jgi:hypothetical protein
MSGRSFRLSEALEILHRTPRALEGLLDGLSDDWTRVTEGGDSWSPLEILGHLVHGETAVWMPRVRTLVEHGERKPFDSVEGGPTDGSLPQLLHEFRGLRQRSIEELNALQFSEEDLKRTGTHPAFGRVTLAQLLATWTVHDLGHVRQMARVMAKRYRTEVGPWQAYLAVLDE